MKLRLSAVAVATLAVLATNTAVAQSGPTFKFSGYGTIGAAHSSEDKADFVGSIFVPNGAGHTRSWSFNPDTRFGAQVAAQFNDKLSGVVQVLSQQQYDNSYTPQVEWANVKYQFTPSFSARLGRIAAPSYLLSESRFVGYASPWLRAPQEVYSVLSITSNDGVDATYRSQIGGANNTVQAFYGKSTAKLPTGKVKSTASWGINDSVEIGSLTLRAGYNSYTIDIQIGLVDQLLGGLKQFAAGAAAVPVPAFQAAGAQALALADKYRASDMALKAIALGASYDPGDWFVMSEFVDFKGVGLLSDSRSWYLSGGYRFGSWTPYATYASTKAKIKPEGAINTTGATPLAAGAAALVGGLNTSLYNFTPTQNTFSVGLRWDAMTNVAVKAQYDRIKPGEQSHGRLKTFTGLEASRNVDVVSLAVDFVF